MKRITLFIFILWTAISMSVAAIYLPVSSDPNEAQKPVFERDNSLIQQNSPIPLTDALNNTLTNGTNINLSLDVLSPLVALVQVQLDSLIGNAPFVSLIQVNVEPVVINNDNVVSTDTAPTETKTIVEPPKEEPKPNTNTTVVDTNTTVVDTNTTNTNTTTDTNTTVNTNTTDTNTTNTTDPGTGNKYLVDNFSFSNTQFTAEITNQNDNVIGDGYYEISTESASNHVNVLQSGTFSYSVGTFTISNLLTFIPVENTEYYILVYTNYPADDNRVSKDSDVFVYSE
jgi:hypothetical protein